MGEKDNKGAPSLAITIGNNGAYIKFNSVFLQIITNRIIRGKMVNFDSFKIYA